jgi:hypothetical protein
MVYFQIEIQKNMWGVGTFVVKGIKIKLNKKICYKIMRKFLLKNNNYQEVL